MWNSPFVRRSPLSFNSAMHTLSNLTAIGMLGVGCCAATVAIVPLVFAAPVQAAVLNSWRFDPATHQLEITLPQGITPRYFLAAEPARIVIDLPGTDVGTVPLQQTYTTGAIRQIRVAQFQPGQTRIVMELSTTAVLAPGQVELQRVGSSQSGDRWVLRPLLAGETPLASSRASTTPAPDSLAPDSPAPDGSGSNQPGNPEPTASTSMALPGAESALPPLEPGALEIPVETPPIESPPVADESSDRESRRSARAREPRSTESGDRQERRNRRQRNSESRISASNQSQGASDGSSETADVSSLPVSAANPPEVSALEATPPETSAPEASAPADNPPQTNALETNPPETSVPEASSPEATSPEISAPETSAPETATSTSQSGELPPAISPPAETPPSIARVTVPSIDRLTAPPGSSANTLPPDGTASGSATPQPALRPAIPEAANLTTNAFPPVAAVDPANPNVGAVPVIEFGEPLPLQALATSDGVIPAGTVLSLRYTGEAPLTLSVEPHQEVLVLEQSVRDRVGNVIIPANSEVIGQFETGSQGSQFRVQAISWQDESLLLNAQSEPLEGDRQVPRRRLLRNSGLGAAIGTLLGAFTGVGLLVGIAAGAATSAAGTYLAAPQPAVIQPNQILEVRIEEDVRLESSDQWPPLE